jgi:hypothetical protein
VQVPRAIHVPVFQSVAINYDLVERRVYLLQLDSPTLSRRDTRRGTLRHCASPLLGQAYSHCLARTDVRARPQSVESLVLPFSS